MVALGVMLLSPSGAFAVSNFSSTPPSNTYVEENIRSMLYLKVWSTSITQFNGTSIQVTGDTDAYENVDTIRVTLYLQYWNGSQWLDAGYIDTFENDDSDYVYGAKDVTVQSGYHYRTKGIHYVNKSGSVEQVNSYSGSIYISE